MLNFFKKIEQSLTVKVNAAKMQSNLKSMLGADAGSIDGAVEATVTEKRYMRRELTDLGHSWEDYRVGFGVNIGKVDGRPVWVGVTAAKISDKTILFIEHTSMLVDFQLIREWFVATFPELGNLHYRENIRL